MLKNFLFIGTIVLAGWVLFFQVLIPYALDRPLFGLFRSRDRLDLERDLAEAKAEGDLYEIEEELDQHEKANTDRARRINQA